MPPTPSSPRFPWLGVILVLALAPLVYLLLSASGGALAVPGVERTPLSPDFKTTTLSGETVNLSDYRGRPVVLNFWASWCPPCRAEMPEFEQVWQSYQKRGIVFLGVNTSDQRDKAQAFLNDFPVSYPHLLDTHSDIARLFSATSLPTTVFINREGRIVGRRIGALNKQQLAMQVEELLK